ncbi:hypothetical protein C3V36_08500 [Lachnospiraceae bacterium oral taxon 500]|nr:hypothetical protein C3V36_08500 [Lachnospiraceae bacterium oral taxon 500]
MGQAMKFHELVTNPKLLRAIKEMGYEEATPIQEAVIPMIAGGGDVIARSQTGTGKTAAFSIPVLDKIDENLSRPQVLILCPTRELAVQVAGEIRKLLSFSHNIKVLPVYGGEPIYKQIMALKKGVQVIVGTPGRIMDHMERKTLRFSEVHTVILDEADEMLKMGFREDIEFILTAVPAEVQKLLFSATMPAEIIELAGKYLKEPGEVKIEASGITTDTVLQSYCAVKKELKPEALFRILDDKSPERCMVFCNTKKMVDEITDALQERGFWGDKIHGDLKQELRMGVLEKFNKGILHILVCTDVAARGLDIQNVDLVVNYDVPDKEEYYVHRIGRSGRAGKAGESITIVTRPDRIRFRNVEIYIQKKIERMEIPSRVEVREKQITRFTENLLSNMETELLYDYEEMVEKLQAKGYSAKQIAAALLRQTLAVEAADEERDVNDYRFDAPKRERSVPERGRERGKERERSKDGGAERKRERAEKPAGSERRERPFEERSKHGKRKGKPEEVFFERGKRKGKAVAEQVRLFLSAGKKHKVSVGDVVGAIVGEAGIDAAHIGTIDMYDKFSFVDVSKESAKKVLNSLQNKRIKGRKLNVEIAKG